MTASKFTPTSRGALLERLAAGVSLRDASGAAGVRENTVKAWITRGRRDGAGAYADFAAQVDQAREAARARPEPMDDDELARAVSAAARKGSVAAMKLRYTMLAARGDEHDEGVADPLAELDELAGRRRGRGGRP
jgi:transposase